MSAVPFPDRLRAHAAWARQRAAHCAHTDPEMARRLTRLAADLDLAADDCAALERVAPEVVT